MVILAGAEALLHQLATAGYIATGIGLGVACGVVGSWIHDLLTAP